MKKTIPMQYNFLKLKIREDILKSQKEEYLNTGVQRVRMKLDFL